MDWTKARENMVEGQVRTADVTDRALIGALLEIPRERFVPAAQRHLAYADTAVPLGAGRRMMAPMHFARMVQIAGIGASDLVLDVGCATGYSTAVLARLAGSVVAIEEDDGLVAAATAALGDIGADNSAVMTAPLRGGLAAEGPYDAILLEGAVEVVPDGLLDQLAEAGRLIGVVSGPGTGRICRFDRRDGRIGRRSYFDAAVPPLPGFAREPAFEF